MRMEEEAAGLEIRPELVLRSTPSMAMADDSRFPIRSALFGTRRTDPGDPGASLFKAIPPSTAHYSVGT